MTIDSKYPASVKAGKPVLGEQPDGWERASLNNFLDLIPRKVKLKDNTEYDLLTVKRSRGGVVRREHLLGKDIKVKSQFEVKAGDFVISKRQIVHGACGLVPPHLDGSIVSNEYSVFHAKPNFDLEFFQYLSETLYFQQTCFHSSIGVHIEKMIFKLEDWFKWTFNIPPLIEQRKIAKILSTWDKAISTTERLIDNSKQQKKALMQQLLTGAHTQRKRLLDDSGKPFEGEWEEVVLKDLCNKVIDNRGKTPPLSEIGLPLVEINSIVNSKYPKLSKVSKFVSPETFKTWFRNGHPERGDILVATVGSAGISALVNLDEGFGSIAQNLIAIRPNSKADSSFLYYLMNTPHYFSLVRAVVMGAVQPSLKVPHLLSFKMKIPSISEQQKIASVLSNADKEVELLEQQLADLKQEKKALMQQLLTGKRRVAIDEAEVA